MHIHTHIYYRMGPCDAILQKLWILKRFEEEEEEDQVILHKLWISEKSLLIAVLFVLSFSQNY